MLRLVRDDELLEAPSESYPFPTEEAQNAEPLTNEELASRLLYGLHRSTDDVLASLDSVSGRIDELAREFDPSDPRRDDDPDGDDDRPRAA